MILYYNADGSLYSFEKTIGVPLLSGTYIIIDEIYENQEIVNRIQSAFSLPIELELWSVSGGNLFRDSVQQTIVQDSDWQTLKNQYQTAIARLQEIENAGAIPFTQTGFNQVVQAIKDVAKYERYILIYLRKTRQ